MAHAIQTPVPAPEAFSEATAEGRMAQAALVMSVGAAVGERATLVEQHAKFRLPDLEPLAHAAPIPLERAAVQLDVDTREYVQGYARTIPADECVRLTAELYREPTPDTAAALIEAALHSRYRLIRTAAAVAALDTTGPRPDVIAELEAAARNRNRDIRDIARTALGRERPPGDPFLRRYETGRTRIRRRARPSNTAVLTHGTFASNTRWWRPGGDFYSYLDGLRPSLHVHDESFRWSGAYSHGARDLAAGDLETWIDAENLDRPDLFAHSHGATVANLATQKGTALGRLVSMGLPVHTAWLPDVGRVRGLFDVRVRFDLVVLADRGGQRLPRSLTRRSNVRSEINGWFSHGSTHEPDYWDDHELWPKLQALPLIP